MTAHHTFSVLCVIRLLLSNCGGIQEGPPTLQPGPIPAPTSTPIPNPDVTVCASGCDFTLIQDAINAESTGTGTIIGVEDPVHTEAGIVVSNTNCVL
jgi:hypothetical protein